MNLTLTKVNGDHLFVPIATYWRASLINAASIHNSFKTVLHTQYLAMYCDIQCTVM